jgi:hypothetical protein
VRKLPAQGALILILAALAVAGCTAAPVQPSRSPSGFVVPTDLTNGRVEITIARSYPVGAALTVPVTIAVTRGTITGPLTARVLASGINEAGAPAEVLVRDLSTAPVSAGLGGHRTLSLVWDTKDQHGNVVPADAYSLVLTFRSEVGTETRTVTAGATLELR